jgi:hypothetical protein
MLLKQAAIIIQRKLYLLLSISSLMQDQAFSILLFVAYELVYEKMIKRYA